MNKKRTEFLDEDIVMLAIQDGQDFFVYSTDLDPKKGVVSASNGMAFPVSKIEPVYVAGECEPVPWFNVYVGDRLYTTVNRNYVVEVLYFVHAFPAQ